MKTIISFLVTTITVATFFTNAFAADLWYTEGNYAHTIRIKLILTNTLDFDRSDCPVVVPRENLTLQNLHQMGVTVVDPSLPARPIPSKEIMIKQGGHNIREETNGQQLFFQMDDLDRDGIWDELFFQTDIGAHEQKTIYLYIGINQRGWMPHGTHAGIGSYCHHLIPFWESANVGWKLWFSDTCDVFGKREPLLMSHDLYMKNLNGYGVKYEYGSDIQRVSNSFGGGAICLFEYPSFPDSVSRPRFARPSSEKPIGWDSNMEGPPLTDTRFAYEVVVNGPVRSMIKAKSMGWRTDLGEYELDQLYTVYTNQNYSTCRVTFTKFLTSREGVMFGCGIRKNSKEFSCYQDGNIVITNGKDELSDPDDDTGAKSYEVEFVGNALAVKDVYNPSYQFVKSYSGNHCFKVPKTEDNIFEYMIFATWDEGVVYNTVESFRKYVIKSAMEFNNPLLVKSVGVENKHASDR
ncbi:DUF4861 family protein [Candidatus Latescibacterota bacterium]